MAGGPFLAVDETRVEAVARLIEKTRRESAPLLEFANAVRDVTRLLSERAHVAAPPAPLRREPGTVTPH